MVIQALEEVDSWLLCLQQKERLARLEGVGCFRCGTRAYSTADRHHIGSQHIDHVASLAQSRWNHQIQRRGRRCIPQATRQ